MLVHLLLGGLDRGLHGLRRLRFFSLFSSFLLRSAFLSACPRFLLLLSFVASYASSRMSLNLLLIFIGTYGFLQGP